MVSLQSWLGHVPHAPPGHDTHLRGQAFASVSASADAGVDQHLASLAHLGGQLGLAVLHTLCGLVLGWLLARFVHKRNWHWHWTAGALVLLVGMASVGHGLLLAPMVGTVPLFSELLGGWGLFVAICVATWIGRSFQQHGQKLGGDVARLAEDSVTPSDAARALHLRWALHRNEPGPNRSTDSSELLLGCDHKGRPLYVPNGKFQGEHVVVVGAPGDGKTVTQTAIAVSRIRRGDGAMIIEGKSDDFMLDQVRRAAMTMGKTFILWTPNGPPSGSGDPAWVYDLLADGNYTELTDRLVADKKWDVDYYRDQGELYLLNAIELLVRRGIRTLPQVIEYCHPDRLRELLNPGKDDDDDEVITGPQPYHGVRPGIERQISIQEEAAIEKYLESLSPKESEDIASSLRRLAILVRADIGRWLDPKTPNTHTFGLRQAIESGAVVYFRLEADARREISKKLTAAIIEDLGSSSNALQGSNAGLVVVLDEFQSIPAENINNLAARGRAAGMTLVLGTQEIRADLKDTLRDQLVNSAKVVIAHCQPLLDSAEYLAKLAGYKWVWASSIDDRGRMNSRRVQELRIEPDAIQSLNTGEAAVFIRGWHERFRIVRVFLPEMQFGAC